MMMRCCNSRPMTSSASRVDSSDRRRVAHSKSRMEEAREGRTAASSGTTADNSGEAIERLSQSAGNSTAITGARGPSSIALLQSAVGFLSRCRERRQVRPWSRRQVGGVSRACHHATDVVAQANVSGRAGNRAAEIRLKNRATSEGSRIGPHRGPASRLLVGTFYEKCYFIKRKRCDRCFLGFQLIV